MLNKVEMVSFMISLKLPKLPLFSFEFRTNAISIIILMWFSGSLQPRRRRTVSQKTTKNLERVVDFSSPIFGKSSLRLTIRQHFLTHLRITEKNWFLMLLAFFPAKNGVIRDHWLPRRYCKNTSTVCECMDHSLIFAQASIFWIKFRIRASFGSWIGFVAPSFPEFGQSLCRVCRSRSEFFVLC